MKIEVHKERLSPFVKAHTIMGMSEVLMSRDTN